MATQTIAILNEFRTRLHENYQKLSGAPDLSSQEVVYLGANHSRIQREIFNAIELLESEEHDAEKAIKERNQ